MMMSEDKIYNKTKVLPSPSTLTTSTKQLKVTIKDINSNSSNSNSNDEIKVNNIEIDNNNNDNDNNNDDEENEQLLDIRRTLEKLLIQKHDKITLERNECWFIIDTRWLNSWAAFIGKASLDDDDNDNNNNNNNNNNNGKKKQYAPLPGKISSFGLLIDNNNSNNSNNNNNKKKNNSNNPTPLPGLKASIDYRAVTPLVYHIFLELYGKDSSPTICRNKIDIYSPPVPIERLINIQYHAMVKAQIAVNRIRPEWIKKLPDEINDDNDDAVCCWGWITKEHIEAFIYWAIRCWSRRGASKDKRNNRNNIKYSQYKPLKNNKDNDDNDDNDDDDKVTEKNYIKENENVSLRNKFLKNGGETSEIEMKRRLIDEPKIYTSNAERGYEKGTWLNSISNSMVKILQR